MKTKTLLSLFLLSGIGFAQLSAQTKTVNFPAEQQNLYVPVDCYDKKQDKFVLADELVGTLYYHILNHYKDGVWVWQMGPCKGEFTSLITQEVFTISDLDKNRDPDPANWTVYYHYNLKGNQGSHYIGYAVFKLNDFSVTTLRATCPGMNKIE